MAAELTSIWVAPGYGVHNVCPPPSQVAKLPFVINDGKWHHICVTWTTSGSQNC